MAKQLVRIRQCALSDQDARIAQAENVPLCILNSRCNFFEITSEKRKIATLNADRNKPKRMEVVKESDMFLLNEIMQPVKGTCSLACYCGRKNSLLN